MICEASRVHGLICKNQCVTVCLQVFHYHIKVKPLQPKLFLSLFLLVLRLYGFFWVCITNHFFLIVLVRHTFSLGC